MPTLLWTNYHCEEREQKTHVLSVVFDIYHCLILKKRVGLPQEFSVDEKFGRLIKVSASGLRHAQRYLDHTERTAIKITDSFSHAFRLA